MTARLHYVQENSCSDYFNRRKLDKKNMLSKVTRSLKICVS